MISKAYIAKSTIKRTPYKLLYVFFENKMETVTIPKQEYKILKEKAEANEDLLIKLVRGLEDIRAGRIKPWKKKFS